VRIGKYLRFIVADDDERALIWNHVGDVHWHCSHLCHNTLCINPYHMIMEDGRYNSSRNSCLKQWNRVTDNGKRLHGIKDVAPCPTRHQPKCFFTDNRTGFVVPENNFRRVVDDHTQSAIASASAAAASSAAAPAVSPGLETYIGSIDNSIMQTPIQQMLTNWKAVGGEWERDMASNWERAVWKVAHGNYRIRHNKAKRLQLRADAANEARHEGNSAAHPMIID